MVDELYLPTDVRVNEQAHETEPAATVVPTVDSEYIQDQIQLDYKFVTPETRNSNPEKEHPLRNIKRDTVLSKLSERDVVFLQDVMELIALADVAEKQTGADYSMVKGYFGSLFQTIVNLKRAQDGFAAQLLKTQRVEQLNVPFYAYPGYSEPHRSNPLSKIPIIGGLFK